MPQTLIKNGIKGSVQIKDSEGVLVTVGGMSDFTIGEDARNILDVPIVFGTERAEVLIQYKGVITGEASGFYLLDSDSGQGLLQAAYDEETELYQDDIRFFLDETTYITPDSSSFFRITSIQPITQTAEGFGTWGIGLHLNGDYNTQIAS